jgi:DnaJ-domain-containing protein 1
VTDYFALLDEPRRPWLEPETLKKKFLVLSANLHPDKIHSAGAAEKSAAAKKFAELNTAYNHLADPKSRLRHLLELELGAKPKDVQQIPPALADLFAEVAAACRDTDTFLAEKNTTTSPLVQIQLFESAQEWIERLKSLQAKLGSLTKKLNDELKRLDTAWNRGNAAVRKSLLPALEELYRLFGYFNRWNSQLQERLVQLSL